MLRRLLSILVLAVLTTAPATHALPPAHDDAGRGQDAPTWPSSSFVVETDVEYEAWMSVVGDVYDSFAFEGAEGDRIAIVSYGSVCWNLLDVSRAVRSTGCATLETRHERPRTFVLDADGLWGLRFNTDAVGPYRFVIVRDGPAPDLSLRGDIMPGARVDLEPGDDPTCGTGNAIRATSGAGDAALPTLVYAALKTGFRAVVAWETAEATVATLAVSLDGGEPVTLAEAAPAHQHVFVLDGLDERRVLCFTPQGGSPHALRLANAMNAHDGNAYTINLLVLANEQPHRAMLEAGLDKYARLLHDATDGHVRSGRIITLFGDFGHHNLGWGSCYMAGFATGDHPLCQHVHDVLFAHDGATGGAAGTYLDGIQRRVPAIWMNQYLQAPLVGLPDDVGSVLAHEMGHYAFGMMDLYGDATDFYQGCWVPSKGLSVMGANRGATEFDDEVNRCPNAASIANYVPSWTLLRERFPLVPDRAGVIDPGPTGDGGAYSRHGFVFAPQVSEVEDEDLQDDAGSGGDAPSTREGAVPIEAGIVYDGIGLGPYPDNADVYVLQGEAGQVFEGWSDGNHGCYSLLAPDGASLGYQCSYGALPLNTGPLVVTLPETGAYHFEVVHLEPGIYRMAFALDAPAPDVRRAVP